MIKAQIVSLLNGTEIVVFPTKVTTGKLLGELTFTFFSDDMARGIEANLKSNGFKTRHSDCEIVVKFDATENVCTISYT